MGSSRSAGSSKHGACRRSTQRLACHFVPLGSKGMNRCIENQIYTETQDTWLNQTMLRLTVSVRWSLLVWSIKGPSGWVVVSFSRILPAMRTGRMGSVLLGISV